MVHTGRHHALDRTGSSRSSSVTSRIVACRRTPLESLSLQTVVYNLISWESITNTPAWLEKQIPTVLSKNAFRKKISLNTYDAESITQAYCYLVSAVSFSLALKYAGTWNEPTASIIVRLRWQEATQDLCFACRELTSNNFKCSSIGQQILLTTTAIRTSPTMRHWNSSFQLWFSLWQWSVAARCFDWHVLVLWLGDGW